MSVAPFYYMSLPDNITKSKTLTKRGFTMREGEKWRKAGAIFSMYANQKGFYAM
jgi:hypothetical protein